MTAPIVVLVEEPSARIVVDAVCVTLGISNHVRVLEHEGKSDLEKSVTRKIAAWRSYMTPLFIVSRDLDGAEREDLKNRLLALVPEHARDRTKVRIVIPELESWYLGDPQALVAAGLMTDAAASRVPGTAKFRDLCRLNNAKLEFKKLVGDHIGQIGLARILGPLLNPERNRSANFQAFITALRWAADRVMAESGVAAAIADAQAEIA